jgi:hypothetical protein
MARTPDPPRLTPLQRAIYETDQTGVNLRDAMRMVTQRLGFFVGQQRYLNEQRKIQAFLDQYGPEVLLGESPSAQPVEAAHQTGSTS